MGDEQDVDSAYVWIHWSNRDRGNGKVGRAGTLPATLFTTFWDATGSASPGKRWALTCSLPGWTTTRDKRRWATQEEAQEHAQKILNAFVARLLGHDGEESK